MTDRNDLRALKALAKRRARALRAAHSKALDSMAAELGYPHWNALIGAWERGWRPTDEQLEGLRDSRGPKVWPRGGDVEKRIGEIEGEPYELEIGFDYVLMGGSGWTVHFGHAPSETPRVEKYVTPNPLDDATLFSEVIKIASLAADQVREAISRDWPRRSTKPNRAGHTMHPLFRGVSAEWFCLHCDTESTGEQMAANMWHCPRCNATPLDIHPTPFWRACL
jgi:hypothetical protein